MKLTTAVLIMGMAATTAWAQNPDAIQNTRDTMRAVQLKKQIDSNAALAASQSGTPQTAARPSTSHATAAHSSSSGPFVRAKAVPHVAKPKASAKAKTAVAAKKPELKPKPKPEPKSDVAVESGAAPIEAEHKAKPVSLAARRDPFVSPVVSQAAVGSGCSTGKRCLAIDQIALKGVVQSEGGMIAVVVNALDKAYFLRENDPVFNGYVVKITGDSIIFKETVQDKVGHPFTREVTKKINTPAV